MHYFTNTLLHNSIGNLFSSSAPPSPSSARLVSQLAIGFPVQSIVVSQGQKIQGEVSFNLIGHCFGFGFSQTGTHTRSHTHLY